MKKRILFLMSDTGGGHRAAAQAIAEAIDYLYPQTYDPVIEDIWKKYTPWPVNQIPNSYPWLTGPGLPLWRLMWSGSAQTQAHRIVLPAISPIVERKIVRYLRTIGPEIVVSVHPFMNHLGLNWLSKARLDIPLITVVTDLVTIHPMWICPRVDFCMVPTGAARERAIKLGLDPLKVAVCGQPVGLKFTTMSKDKPGLRQKLGLDLSRPTILLIGGGEGVGRLFEIARAIAQTVAQAQLLIVTGRNKALKQRLAEIAWEIPTRIFGFVENMPELMAVADLLITKAGPGTISEAFVAGLPLIIFGYIPGQEEGNVTYVQEHGAGVYAETPAKIAGLVLTWLAAPNDILRRMARQSASLAQPQASLTIAKKVCSLIGATRSVHGEQLARQNSALYPNIG